MPHNRAEREKEVREKYHFVVFGGEYSLAHVLLSALDIFVNEGQYTADFVWSQVKGFGIDLITEMLNAGLDPTQEPMYVGKFIFENWENFQGQKIQLPNKFVPYVAARKIAAGVPPPSSNTYKWQDFMADDLVFLGKPTGEIYTCNGTNKWHVPAPEHVLTLVTMFAPLRRYGYQDFPKQPGWTDAEHQAAWNNFVNAIPDA
jgi:hypothetical protein